VRNSQPDSPSLVLLTVNGRNVPVCGKSTNQALWAAALVDTVLRRGEDTPLPTSREGGVRTVRITRGTLARFLQDLYGDEPATVAEAVMALRKLDPVKAAWLVRVLSSTPELAVLARAVQAELTGEAHDHTEGDVG
jgi:hypothetical protein